MSRTIRFGMATLGLAQIAAGLYPLIFNAAIEGFWKTLFTALIVSAVITTFLLIAIFRAPMKLVLKTYTVCGIVAVGVYMLRESHRIMVAEYGPLFLTNLFVFVVSIGSGVLLLVYMTFINDALPESATETLPPS